jgi:hypothetical protein
VSSEYVNGQINRHWCSENSYAVNEEPLYFVKAGNWVAVGVRGIRRQITLFETINSESHED